jgi:hypothetical protein
MEGEYCSSGLQGYCRIHLEVRIAPTSVDEHRIHEPLETLQSTTTLGPPLNHPSPPSGATDRNLDNVLVSTSIILYTVMPRTPNPDTIPGSPDPSRKQGDQTLSS